MITQLAAAYNNRGVALRSSGDVDRAMEDYDRALRLLPDYYVALNNRGVALMGKGEPDRAVVDFDRAIQLRRCPITIVRRRLVAKGSLTAPLQITISSSGLIPRTRHYFLSAGR